MGHPAEEILHFVDENDIDLILMATHGRSGIRRWAMGSVADKVLRASEVPVLLVRAGIAEESTYDEWPMRTILVPLDGSELAESVLPHVEMLAKRQGLAPIEVVLFTICRYPVLSSDYPTVIPLRGEEDVEQETAKARRIGEQYLDGVERRLKAAGLMVHCEALLDEPNVGSPAEVIIDYANRNPFTLIAMATHGRSGISRWAFGSAAERVLQGTSRPVLLVRA